MSVSRAEFSSPVRPGYRKSIIITAVIFCVLGVGVISAINTRRMQRRMMCSSNLAKIGQALLNYAPSDSSGPAHLEKLVEQGILKRGEIICPASQGGVSNYILTQSFARPDHADAGVLVYEPLSNHGDGMNVFFAGGQCKFVLKAQIGQLGIPLP